MGAFRDILRVFVERAGVSGVVDMERDILFAPSIATVNRTCSADLRSTVRQTRGGVGVADTFEICQKNAADTYAWKTFDFLSLMPTGAVTQYALATAPSGWMLCEGDTVLRSTTLGALLVAAGLPYGTGDGSTTVNVPNIKGKVVVGLDSGDTDFDTLGETRGAKTHTLTSAQSGMPAHEHVYTFTNFQSVNTTTATAAANRMANGSFSAQPTTGGTAQNAASAHNNIQPSIVLKYIIKL